MSESPPGDSTRGSGSGGRATGIDVEVDLSNELIACAFAHRGDDTFEGPAALVRLLGVADGEVQVSRRFHPPAVNVMEPVNQAMEIAADERSRMSAEIIAEEKAAGQPEMAQVPEIGRAHV